MKKMRETYGYVNQPNSLEQRCAIAQLHPRLGWYLAIVNDNGSMGIPHGPWTTNEMRSVFGFRGDRWIRAGGRELA